MELRSDTLLAKLGSAAGTPTNRPPTAAATPFGSTPPGGVAFARALERSRERSDAAAQIRERSDAADRLAERRNGRARLLSDPAPAPRDSLPREPAELGPLENANAPAKALRKPPKAERPGGGPSEGPKPRESLPAETPEADVPARSARPAERKENVDETAAATAVPRAEPAVAEAAPGNDGAPAASPMDEAPEAAAAATAAAAFAQSSTPGAVPPHGAPALDGTDLGALPAALDGSPAAAVTNAGTLGANPAANAAAVGLQSAAGAAALAAGTPADALTEGAATASSAAAIATQAGAEPEASPLSATTAASGSAASLASAQAAPAGQDPAATGAGSFASALAGAAGGTAPSTSAEPPVLHGRLAAHPASPQFVPQLGAQLEMFIREGVQSARLQLHPAELGPVAVQLQLEGGQAQVALAADHALTREKLIEALPQLQRQLEQQGLAWAGGSVGSQLADGRREAPQRESETSRDAGAARNGHRGDTAAGGDGTPTALAPRRARGLVDLVA